MKSLILLFTFSSLLFTSHAQQPDPAQIERLKKLAEGMKGMSPQQMLKQQDSIMKVMKKIMAARDSIITDVTTQASKKLPNGDQLLIKHHFDTGFTQLKFLYTLTTSAHSTKSGSDTYFSCGGSTNKAPKIYEANGHFIVGSSTVGAGANTSTIDSVVNNINRDRPYMDPAIAQKNTDIARQASFSTLLVNDHGLQPSVSYTSLSSGECANDQINIQGLPTKESFVFEFDPVTNFSSIGLGASFKVLEIGQSTCYLSKGNSSQRYLTGLGFSGTTDVTKAKMVGQSKMTNSDPDATYINVRKSGGGVSISYQRSKTFTNDGGYNTMHESLSAFIGDADMMYEAIIRPVEVGKFKYDRWLPSGPKTNGSNDKKGDDSLQFYIEIRNTKDTTKLYPGSFTVNWLLDDVTKYPGFCNNYPKYTDNPIITPDLKFDSLLVNNGSLDAASITDHTANSKTEMGNNAFAHIICMDYGAYGKLKAIITMDDGSIINAISPYDKSEYLSIPLDINNNKIADAWEKKEGVYEKNYSLNWDEDELPKDLGKPAERGDGYTLLEEYRGFSANKKHFRSSANTMDLMVLDLIDGRSKDGINMYRGVTQVIVHDDFKQDEFGRGDQDVNVEGIDHDKCLNFNFTPETHSVDQHGIVLIKSNENVSYAQAVSKTGPTGKDLEVGTPKSYKYLKITPGFDPGPDGYNITQGNISVDTNHVSGDPAGNAKIISDSYSHTVAHEMLHCSNVRHHGATDLSKCLLIAGRNVPNGTNLNGIQVLPNRLYLVIGKKLYATSNSNQVLWENGDFFSDRFVPNEGISMWIGTQGGQHSGFEDCIMRYRNANAYLSKNDEILYIFESKAGYNNELAGIYLCTSSTGTGVNDSGFAPRPRYGDATLGDCKHQFCINDKYHEKVEEPD